MAENILETIAAKRRIYIEEKKKQVPLKNLISQAEALLQKEAAGEVSAKPSFYDSLAGDKLSDLRSKAFWCISSAFDLFTA